MGGGVSIQGSIIRDKQSGKWTEEKSVMNSNHLEQAIMKWDIPETERILKESLQKRPNEISMWLKLSLTELQYPYCDYKEALLCLDHIYEIDHSNLDALLLEAGIRWHNMGYIDKSTFDRIRRIDCPDHKTRAMIYYMESLYYQGEKDLNNQKRMLQKSIEEYDQYVYPFKDLGTLLFLESNHRDGKEMLKKAVNNVKTVFMPGTDYDFTDIDLYIAEFITGTGLSASNFEYLQRLCDYASSDSGFIDSYTRKKICI